MADDRINYGVQVLKYEHLVKVAALPPETPAEQLRRATRGGLWSLSVIAGTAGALVVGSVGLAAIGAGSLGPIFGVAVGMLAFMVWDAGRG